MKKLSKSIKDEFWDEVEKLLIDFFKLDKVDAQARIEKLRNRIHPTEKPFPDYNADMFYHNDPMIIAEELFQYSYCFGLI